MIDVIKYIVIAAASIFVGALIIYMGIGWARQGKEDS